MGLGTFWPGRKPVDCLSQNPFRFLELAAVEKRHPAGQKCPSLLGESRGEIGQRQGGHEQNGEASRQRHRMSISSRTRSIQLPGRVPLSGRALYGRWPPW